MFKKCREVATRAHFGQARFNGGPYINHPISVAGKFKEEKLKCIAILHDVIEDTVYNSNQLLSEGISKEIVEVVSILSRKKGEPYTQFIMRVCENQDAIRVKIADIEHNLSDLKEGSLKDKYGLALIILKMRCKDE